MIVEIEKFFKCAGCCSTGSRPLLRVGPAKAYRVIVCTSCGLAHLLPKPNDLSDTHQLGDTATYAAAVNHLRPGFVYHHGLLLNKLRQFAPPPNRLLEIGCGRGDFLVAAKDVGYQVSGVEPAAVDAQVKDRVGIPIWSERIEQVLLPKHHFGLAVAIQVIEHMHDPWIFCEKISQTLTPGGILYIETPNFGALARRCHSRRFMDLNVAPGHWHLFESRSLGNLLLRAGIEPIKTWTFFKSLSAYGRGPIRPAIVTALNTVFRPLGLANTLAVIGQKS